MFAKMVRAMLAIIRPCIILLFVNESLVSYDVVLGKKIFVSAMKR